MKVKDYYTGKMSLSEWIIHISENYQAVMEDGNIQLVPINEYE